MAAWCLNFGERITRRFPNIASVATFDSLVSCYMPFKTLRILQLFAYYQKKSRPFYSRSPCAISPKSYILSAVISRSTSDCAGDFVRAEYVIHGHMSSYSPNRNIVCCVERLWLMTLYKLCSSFETTNLIMWLGKYGNANGCEGQRTARRSGWWAGGGEVLQDWGESAKKKPALNVVQFEYCRTSTPRSHVRRSLAANQRLP